MEKKNALLSVFHKEGIVEFASELIALGWRIISSGGTAKALQSAGLPVTDAAEISGLPAILGHRVVTLVPQIHGGLLAAEEHREELEQLGYPWIDLVCVDLYPLKQEVQRDGSTEQSVIEKTDIGGPTMLRSGAKGRRIVVVDPADRTEVITWLKADRPNEREFRNALAAKAEAIIADYCLESARYHSSGAFDGVVGSVVATCRYGENAWQTPARLYTAQTADPLAIDRFKVIEGLPLSYNNIIDIDRLLQTATHAAEAMARNGANAYSAIAIGVKHGNPCGAAAGEHPSDVANKMMAGDPLAIFGGLVMVNFTVDEVIAESFVGKMLDGIIAPSFTDGAVSLLRRKGDRCRFVVNDALGDLVGKFDNAPRIRYVRGGFLLQPNYTFVPDFQSQVTKHGVATELQERDLRLAWAIGSTSNSNTITLVKDGQLLGNGVGQQDRVGAAELAIRRAQRSGHDVAGAVAYSDSFFPFPDGPQTLIDAGVKAIFTSSGSVNDHKTINLCAERGVALYMVADQSGRGFFGH